MQLREGVAMGGGGRREDSTSGLRLSLTTVVMIRHGCQQCLLSSSKIGQMSVLSQNNRVEQISLSSNCAGRSKLISSETAAVYQAGPAGQAEKQACTLSA